MMTSTLLTTYLARLILGVEVLVVSACGHNGEQRAGTLFRAAHLALIQLDKVYCDNAVLLNHVNDLILVGASDAKKS